MKNEKTDYSKIEEDIFFELIYPLHAIDFLFGNDYERFASIVAANFKLNPKQWEQILEHWELKERIRSTLRQTNWKKRF